MFIEWNDKFSMHIEEIDNQHKLLVKMINEIHEGIQQNCGDDTIGNILKAMLEYSETHFDTEERLMAQYGFPGYEEHKKEHDIFRKEAVDLYERFKAKRAVVTMEMAVFLRSWFETHFLGTDVLYVDFFMEKGVH